MILPDGHRVADVYCCEKTADKYPDAVNGLHLMLAQYNGAKSDLSVLFFHYPSTVEKQFSVAVMARDKALLRNIDNRIKKGDYALIFAVFSNRHCYIDSDAQVVPIRATQERNLAEGD